jgi:hypothetical protein
VENMGTNRTDLKVLILITTEIGQCPTFPIGIKILYSTTRRRYRPTEDGCVKWVLKLPLPTKKAYYQPGFYIVYNFKF